MSIFIENCYIFHIAHACGQNVYLAPWDDLNIYQVSNLWIVILILKKLLYYISSSITLVLKREMIKPFRSPDYVNLMTYRYRPKYLIIYKIYTNVFFFKVLRSYFNNPYVGWGLAKGLLNHESSVQWTWNDVNFFFTLMKKSMIDTSENLTSP